MNQTTWATQFLQAMGIYPSQLNIDFVTAWTNAESAWGTAAYGNPLNIEDSSIGYDPNATAAWLKANGNFGGIGTYGQNLINFLSNQPNNMAQSFAYWTGHSGDTTQLTASYQSLLGMINSATGGIAGPIETGASNPAPTPDQPNAGGANYPATVGPTLDIPGAIKSLTNALQQTGLIFVAGALVIGGIIIMVMSNNTVHEVVDTTAKGAALA